MPLNWSSASPAFKHKPFERLSPQQISKNIEILATNCTCTHEKLVHDVMCNSNLLWVGTKVAMEHDKNREVSIN